MNLRKKLLLGIGIALIVTFALVAIFSYISMEKSFRQLEQEDVTANIIQAEKALLTDYQSLQSTTRDYAAWTDTYRFVTGENPDWGTVNLQDDFFARFNIQGAVVTDANGSPVVTHGFDATTGTAQDLPASLVQEIQAISIAYNIHNTTSASFLILDTPEGAVIVSSHPVLTDNFAGEGTGALHLIRKIDERYMNQISEREGQKVRVIRSADVPVNGMRASGLPKPIIIVTKDDEIISGYTPLSNLRTKDTYYLEVTEPRSIYQSGQAAISTFLISLLGAGVFIIIFTLLFVDRIILSRLNTIIGTVRRRKDIREGEQVTGEANADELASLAREIDPVFEKLAESRVELQQSEERYRILAESAQDFIYVINDRDEITYINKFAAASVGRSPEELIGKMRSDLFPQKESERQYENIRKVLTTGTPLKIESNLPLPSGERWTDTLLVPIRDRNGLISGVMGITRDITQRKKAEEALARTNKKLNLLSSITRHDILNQLTAMRTYLELSLDYTSDPEITDFIHKEQGIATIIDQQITFTRDYQQMGVTAPGWQDLHAIISWTIQPLASKGITIMIGCRGIEVFADPMFEKVFYNIVENSLRYGGDALTRIDISCKASPEGLVITLEDDGEGIPPEHKEKIFERGFGKNTGFGLFLSREILSITGMKIRETGTFGKGARFEIFVPPGEYRGTDRKQE